MQVDWQMLMEESWRLASSDVAPAWAQALLSFAALLIAIRVSKLSVEHANSLRQKTMFSVVDACRRYACSIRNAINAVSDVPGSNISLYGVYHKDVAAGMIKALQALPVHEFGTSQQVISTLGVTDQFVFLAAAAEKLLVDPSLLPEYQSSFDELRSDRESRIQSRGVIIKILKENALRHLDKIDEYYEALKRSIPK